MSRPQIKRNFRLLGAALFLAIMLHAQSALEIVEPADTSLIRPGAKVVVNVRTGNSYADLWLQSDSELHASGILHAPPYRFSVDIPQDIVAGLYRLWATGCRRPGDCDDFGSITISVEPVWRENGGYPLVTDAPGVTVGTGGVPVAIRFPMLYPEAAMEAKIGGPVMVEVIPDPEGKVDRVQILSGPAELRKDVIKAMLTWRFPAQVGLKPRQIEIRFDPNQESADRFQRGLPASKRESALPAAVQAIQPGSPVPQRIRGDAKTQAAKLISKVDPVYPPLAKVGHFQGVVRFNAIISKEGRVENIQIISGHPLLVEAAQNSVKQWTYSPTLVNGTAVEVVTQIEVEFFLLN